MSHDAHDPATLVVVGDSPQGTTIRMDREYVSADLKILTGLVESHFMAGVSGGRKSICRDCSECRAWKSSTARP